MLARLALSLSALSYALVLPVLELRAPAALDLADGSLHLYRSWHLLTLISLGAYALTRLWWCGFYPTGDSALRELQRLRGVFAGRVCCTIKRARGETLTPK